MTRIKARQWVAAGTAIAVSGLMGFGSAGQAAGAEATHDRIVSANPENFTPNVEDGKVDAMVQVGNRIIAVGKFTRVTPVGGATVTRNNIFAFNATTGALDTGFTPNVGTAEVFDVVDAGDGTTVYIGGQFTSVNGTAVPGRVARINATSGALVSQFAAPTLNKAITDMQLINGRLYIGGSFTTIGGQPNDLLAALNPTTGANTGHLNLDFADTWNGGSLTIKHFDISDDGSKLVAVGNFRNVNGQSRPQIVMVNTSGTNATLADWATQRYTTDCASVFDTYMRDVDIAPSGGYFVVAATGAFSGGVGSGTLCDTVTRWELNATGGGQDPTWADYSGGDTLTQVKVTGPAIYVGGHQRWMNNPFVGDAVGPGAVPREGLAAVDPRNGLPFSWNPGRARGVGVWEFLPTTAGLWIGHDTNRLGGETRKRIALMPLTGGVVPPAENTGTLPGDVFLLGQPSNATNAHWIARVNAAGPTLLANDNGPDWSADTADQPSPFHNGNSNAADWGDLPIARGANLPSTTPTAIFSTERWSPDDNPNMQWDFPAPVGHSLTVRLYFSNGYDGTEAPGQRVFNVNIDGGPVELPNYDIVADVGDQTGTMKSFNITSDGNVDIDFSHVVENPLVNGIEIIDNDVPAPPPNANNTVIDRDFTGTTVTGSVAGPTGNQTWSNARGAVMIDNTVYTGWSDGTLKARTFNGTTWGAATNVNLFGLTSFANELPNITGMFYDRVTARLYYTLAGQAQLYYRYFEPESRVVGAVRFDGPGNGNGVDWRDTSGMFLAGGQLYIGSSVTGNLARVGWSNGALTGVAANVSGPTLDGFDWRARGTFLYAG
jgi:hypothetical protein